MDSTGLPCMNCGQPVGGNDGKFFAETFVCGSCFAVASRMYERAHQELKLVLLLTKDAIRTAILQKRLQFKTPEQLKDIPKADFLADLSRLVDAAQEREELCHNQTTRSMGSTKQLVHTQGVDSHKSLKKLTPPGIE